MNTKRFVLSPVAILSGMCMAAPVLAQNDPPAAPKEGPAAPMPAAPSSAEASGKDSPKTETAPVVRANRIELTDKQGRVRMVLGVGIGGIKGDNPAILLLDEKQNVKASVLLGENGHPVFSLFDSKGRMRSVIGLGENEVPGLALFDEAGKATGFTFDILQAALGKTFLPTTPQAPVAEPASVPTSDTVETVIEGTFEGWTGETVFKLDNGQIWQQDRYAYTYHYAFRPKVVIFKSGSVWKMKVDGVSDPVVVKRIK